MGIKRNIFVVLLLILASALKAQELPDPMLPARLVNDFAGIFDKDQTSHLEQVLRAYNDTTSTQIYVVTVSDLQGYAPSDYATRLGEKWGVGQKDKNNGVVILIKPRIGNERGQVFISVGYGIEPILNDARIGRIIDNDMLPHFASGDYYSGTIAAVGSIINYLSGQFEADPHDDMSLGAVVINILIVVFFIFLLIRSFKGGDNGSSGNRRGGGGWFGPIGGGGGSFGGGGFGGGGGGSFGGGGAGRGF